MIGEAGAPRECRRYLVFLLLAFLYLYPFMRLGPGVADEGELLYDAVRVTHGQVPARDFFEGMAPGTFYWLALYFKVFGTTWFVSRISLMATSLSIATLMYYLFRRLHDVLDATPAILLAATSFGVLWPAISHHGDSTLFALLSFAVLLNWLENRRRIFLLLAGVLAGLTTCFLQQKGLLLFLSFVLVMWLLCRREPRFWLLPGWLAAGYGAVGLCVVLLFYSAGALRQLVYADLIFPLTRYGYGNSVPYAMGIFNFYWPRWTVPLSAALSPAAGYVVAGVLIVPFLCVAALPVLLAAFALKRRDQALTRATLPYWVCGFALWLSEMQRKDIWHLVYGSPLLILLGLHVYGRSPNKWNVRAMRLLAACAWFLAIFNLLAVSMARTPIATRRGVVYGYQRDAVLEYLNDHIRPGEEILAYPYRPMYYFLLEADNATKYSFFTPGMHTESQFREAVDSLEAKKIKHVIWDTTYDDPDMAWANPHVPRPLPIVEPYLMEHYTIVYFNRGVRLLERKQ